MDSSDDLVDCFMFFDTGGEGQCKNCLCGLKDCENPRIVPCRAPDGQWVVLPVVCEESRLVRMLDVLFVLVESSECRRQMKKDYGTYICRECVYVFEAEDDFVTHLSNEMKQLDWKLKYLLQERQGESGKCGNEDLNEMELLICEYADYDAQFSHMEALLFPQRVAKWILVHPDRVLSKGVVVGMAMKFVK